MNGRLAILGLLVLCVPAAAAQRSSPNNFEYQYMDAIRAGEIEKARDIAQLSGINPRDIAGLPVVSWLSVTAATGWSSFTDHDATFTYLFDELKMDFNAPWRKGESSLFSMACRSMTALRGEEGRPVFKKNLARIYLALSRGADGRGIRGSDERELGVRPLQVCAREFVEEGYEPNRQDLLALMAELIKRGADPNDGGDLAGLSAQYLEDGLFTLVAKHGAKLGAIYPVSGKDGSCAGAAPNNTLLSLIVEPKDTATDYARAFLIAYQASGGDVAMPQSTVGEGCRMESKTLKQRAMDGGQFRYAKMVDELEKAAAKRAVGAER